MDHGGEVPTTVESTDLIGVAGVAQGGEASHMTSRTFHGQFSAAAARHAGFEPTSVAYPNSAEFARHVRAALGGAVPVAVFHREPGPGVVYASIRAVYDNRGMAAEHLHLRRLFAFVGIATSSVAVNWLAAGPGSPAVAFHLFVLLLGGLFLVILHVLRV